MLKAFVTFFGKQGGKQSVRRPLEVLSLSDGTKRVRLDLKNIPARASMAEVEFVNEDSIFDSVMELAGVKRLS